MDALQEAFDHSEEKAEFDPLSEAMRAFGQTLKNLFTLNEGYRRAKELEWLESLRQYKGLYDPDVTIDANNSKVYPKITRSKINIVLSRLHEMLFPETDKNHEITTSPEPKIAPAIVAMLAQALTQQDPQTGELVPPTQDDLMAAVLEFAKKTCERMAVVIDDQLLEMDYPEETKKVLRSGLTYGTGILKGPMIRNRVKRRWEARGPGVYEENISTEEVPFYEFVRIWDWYPDMTVTDTDKMEGSWERHIMTKHDLRLLAKRGDFYSKVILEYMRDHPSGDYVAKNWEVDLQVIEVEAGAGKIGQTTKMSSAVTGDDTQRSTNRQLGKKYEVLEYWGYVDGSDLQTCGLNIEDVELEYAANVWILGNRIIRAALFDKALDQYKVFYYEKDETSLFGEGLARVIRHSQIAIAAASRMVLDNAACVSGPQVEVNWSLTTPGTDISSIYPRKIWYREGKGVDAQYPAIRSLQFESHIPELLSISDAFKQFADEESTLPTWLIGQMMNNETAQATSGRMGMITISIKDVVKNFDAFTEKVIGDLYAWNMEFNPREDIKGDYNVKARGVSSLVMKEVRMQAMNQLATTMTPEDWVYVSRRDFLKERFKAYDLVIPLKTEEEAEKIRQQAQSARGQQLAYEQMEAEIAYKKAQTLGQLTKAKKFNVEAAKDAETPIEQQEGSDPRLTEEEIATRQTKRAGEEARIRREEEKHAQEMRQREEQHGVDLTVKAVKTDHDLKTKDKMTESSIKMKEKMSESAAKAKRASPKPGKGVK